jgi:hypothetical protein
MPHSVSRRGTGDVKRLRARRGLERLLDGVVQGGFFHRGQNIDDPSLSARLGEIFAG